MAKSFRHLASAALCALAITSCSKPAVDEQPQAVAEPIAPAPPTHNYTTVDDGEYLYAKELSEADRTAGQAAAGFAAMRYMGEKDGIYKLGAVGSGLLTCTNPCEVIKVYRYGQLVDRIQFVPGTIAAAAFEDAFNGQLSVYTPPESHAANSVTMSGLPPW